MNSLEEIISQNILQSLPVGLLVVGQTGEFVTANPAAAAILGLSREDLLGRGLGELFFADPANHPFGQVLVEVIGQELVGVRREVPYRTPDGRSRQLSVTSSYLRADAAKAGVVVILHDITELTRMQRRENEVLTEINQLQEDKIRCLSKLASSVAHQIRNPAAAIGGFAARLERLLQSKGLASDYPAIILEEARRLEGIVRTVGRFAALSRQRLAPAGLGDILATARAQAEERTSVLGRVVTWHLDVPTVELVADAALLAVALAELFDNAIRYAQGDAASIRVTGAVADDRLGLEVADDGPGVAPADRPHIFDPFYSSRPEGSGMGLPLALEILIDQGGSIRLDGTQGPGARFVLSLPLFPRHLVSRLEDPAATTSEDPNVSDHLS